MNKGMLKAIFLLSLLVTMVSTEALGAGGEPDLTDLYDNMLIGELFPSGNVYLERFSLEGGHDNQQQFAGLNYSEQIEIYPLKKAKWVLAHASFSRLIKATYIKGLETSSSYFSYPFSKPPQDALLYSVEGQKTQTAVTVVSFLNHTVEKMTSFDGSETREYSQAEYEAAVKHMSDDHESKDQYDSTLAKISEENTILHARKLALFRIKNLGCEVLLSVYNTHGIEYAATVYVADFIKNGEVVLTKEKYNFDGPY